MASRSARAPLTGTYMDASPVSSDDERTEVVLGHISGVVMQRAMCCAVMSCEPAAPNTHTCLVDVIGTHVPGGLKAGAMTALFIIIAALDAR
jgi:hypothetical protein